MLENVSVPNQPNNSKKTGFKKNFFKIFKWIFILFSFLFITLITVAFIYENEIKQKVIEEINKKLNAEITVKKIDFSIFKKFPQASILLNDLEINSAKQKETEKNKNWKKKLIIAKEISLQFNILNILSKNYDIKKITIEDATINLLITDKGKTNFEIFKTDNSSANTKNISFNLNAVLLKNVSLNYYNAKSKDNIAIKIIDSKLKGNFFENDYSLETKGKYNIAELKLENTHWLKNKNIETNFNLEVKNNHEFIFKNSNFNLENLNFLIEGKLKTEENKNTFIDYTINANEVNIHQLISLLPEQYAQQANEYKSSGILSFQTTIKGEISDKKNPVITSQFSINNGSITHKESNITLNKITLTGELNSFESKNNKNNFFKISNFSSNLGNGNINGALAVTDFETPNIQLQANARINIDELLSFLSVDTIENSNGKLSLNVNYNGKIKTKAEYQNINLKDEDLTGELILEDVAFKFKHGNLNFSELSTKINSTKSDVTLNYLKGKAGDSDFNIQGELTNLLSFLFKNDESLKVNATLNASKINLTEILASKEKTEKKDSVFSFHLSDKFNVNFICNVEQLIFEKFTANNIKGNFILLDKQIKLEDIVFNAMEGNVNATAVINGKQDDVFEVKGIAILNNINISKLMYELNNFGQEDLTDKNLKGKVASTVNFYGKWNSDLTCITSSINSTADILISNGELLNFEPMLNLSRFIAVEELKNIKFSELKNTIEIKNKNILIPGMLIKSSVLDLSVSGIHNFDNIVDYHFKLKLGDLLFRKAKAKKQDLDEFAEEDDGERKGMNLYISMTGPISDPKIRYDKQGFKKSFKEIKVSETSEVKSLLKEEFGWFKNQSISAKKEDISIKKEPQIEWEETKKTSNEEKSSIPALKPESKINTNEKNKKTKKEKVENADDFF